MLTNAKMYLPSTHLNVTKLTLLKSNRLTNTTFAEMDDDGSLDFPIGRHVWEFSHGFCGREKLEEHSLTLSQCHENVEFTCDDGTCISMEEVCDRRTQCDDRSDEIDCSTVELPRGYQSTLPPPSPSTVSALPVYLNISLRLAFVRLILSRAKKSLR
ncbi:uncharacterized protein LOC135091546 [Scylla paramamosain]|uniref:uncharacterized protein LOC135091546 n=1 Tax=Scylla paramamosain TaxID=85552 RepID=UPI003082CFEA